ncbi:MAG: RpiB/LacA/LacB family sugar-phosphate isomerase, partial [Staphylococcus epidermidis]|nr:RpiB/LacA/LacB family sugar-phosphate isomerase [Staphylococcus epidermidis]
MTIIIGSDVDGKRLKELIKAYLEDNDYDVLDVTEGKDLDFVDSTVSVAKEVQKSDDNLGIAIDAYGAG